MSFNYIKMDSMNNIPVSNGANFNVDGPGAPSDKKEKVVKLLLLLGVVVVLGLIIFLGMKLFGSSDSSGNVVPVDDVVSVDDDFSLKPDYGVLEFVLAEEVDDDFNYVRRANSEFFSGEDLYIYSRLEGFEEEVEGDGYRHSILESVYVYDENGDVVESMSKENLEKESSVFDEKYLSIKFSIKIPIEEDLESGDYEVEVKYKDLISQKTISERESFVVKNMEDTLGGRVTSLSQDLSGIGVDEGVTFVQTIEVYGPDEKLIESVSSVKEYTVPQGSEPVYETQVVLPNSFAPGEYRVVVINENKETGDKITDERTIVALDRFKVLDYVWYGIDDIAFEAKDDNVYYPGDTVVVNVMLAGMGYDFKNDMYGIHITEDIKTYAPSGELIEPFSMDDYFEVEESYNTRLERYEVENSLNLPDFVPNGKYRIEMSFTDEVVGKNY